MNIIRDCRQEAAEKEKNGINISFNTINLKEIEGPVVNIATRLVLAKLGSASSQSDICSNVCKNATLVGTIKINQSV